MPPRGSRADGAPTTAVAKRSAVKRQSPAITTEYVESLMAYATVLYKGGLAPKGAGRPETVAAIIAVGRDVGLPDTQALANIMIVGGKPTIYGDAGLALIRASGQLEDIEETYEGEPDTDEFTAVCTITRVGGKRPRTVRFSLADAKRAKLLGKPGPWQEFRNRQLMWRAKSWACRDEFQDVLCGLWFYEEAIDIPNVRVETPVSVVDVGQDAGKSGAVPVSDTAVSRPAIESPKLAESQPQPQSTTLANPESKPELTGDKPNAEQLRRFGELRDLICVNKGATTDEDRLAVWLAALEPYQLTTVRNLSESQAEDLITALGMEYDPFVNGGKKPAQT